MILSLSEPISAPCTPETCPSLGEGHAVAFHRGLLQKLEKQRMTETFTAELCVEHGGDLSRKAVPASRTTSLECWLPVLVG